VKGKNAAFETVIHMVLAAHVIETEQVSSVRRLRSAHIIRVRRLILLGLACAMALATLAPVVVLAG
jgi:hypothetical protein